MMGVMSIREFNANTSAAFAKVEAGEVIEVTRNGKVIAEVRPKRANRTDDPEFRGDWESLMAGVREGIPGLTGPATYEERTGRGS
jgi:antitoxin (DNA-binding transcriptional repressor) of toxin-antitoxin stability system